jgi:hypothetical protein
MFVHESLMNARHDRLRPADQQRLIRQLRDLARTSHRAGWASRADDRFPQAQPPGGASLMNHTVAASSHSK